MHLRRNMFILLNLVSLPAPTAWGLAEQMVKCCMQSISRTEIAQLVPGLNEQHGSLVVQWHCTLCSKQHKSFCLLFVGH